ncbi:MAG: hypothetical protein ACXVY9_10815 [Terriglobales bacterium]
MESAHMEQLLDMAAVHAFYMGLLEETLRHPVPVPHEVVSAAGGGAVAQSQTILERWLDLLDLAITPTMIRDALKESTTRETAEALLRHFVRKSSPSDTDRDKTDFVITFLYRAVVPPARQIAKEMNVDEPSEFEEEIYKILDSDETRSLPEEHRQLVREFPFVQQEVEDYNHFDQLMDSGVIQRARELKQRFGVSFYHPRVLATIAAYNVYFGSRFDHLFKQAAAQIKRFASNVQEQGGSIMSRVDGDVTVLNLTEVEQHEGEILHSDYRGAQEQLRKISVLKKAVDSRTGARPHAPAAAVAAHAAASLSGSGQLPHVPEAGDPVTGGVAIELGKLRVIEDSIRNFILAADPNAANVVPLHNGNLSLTNAEVEAYRANYGAEKSFRSDYTAAVRQAIAIYARIQVELQEYNSKLGSAYLWKPHADSLAFLINSAQRLQEQCGAVLSVAEQRGLADKVNAITGALQKMRQQLHLAAKALQENQS